MSQDCNENTEINTEINIDEKKNHRAIWIAKFIYFLSILALIMVIILTVVSYFISELAVPLQWTTDLSNMFSAEDDHKAHTFLYTLGIEVVIVYLSWLVNTLMDKNRLAKYRIYRLAIPYVVVMLVFITTNLSVFLHTVTQPTI